MAWTAPRTWTTGEIVTAALMNAQIRDNMLETAPAKTAAAGDLYYGTAANAIAALTAGSARQILQMNSGGTLPEWTDELKDLADAYIRTPGYGTTAGTASAYTLTLTPALPAYADGVGISIKMHLESDATPTININALGAKTLKAQNGDALSAGDLLAGSIYNFRYDGTDFLQSSSGGLFEYFGDGSDGALSTTGNVTESVTIHTGLVVKNYTSIAINSGHTYTTNNPCRGLILYSQGDVTIDGTLHMNEKGGYGAHHIPPILITKETSSSVATLEKYFQLATVFQALRGGNGGNGGANAAGNAGGTGGTGRLFAGGYGGGGNGGGATSSPGAVTTAETGAGTGAQAFADGSGTGYAANIGYNGAGSSGLTNRLSHTATPGAGGNNRGGGGGGGGQARSDGANATATSGSQGNYAGGFVCIIAKGNVTISGTVSANGGSGGNGGNAAGTGTFVTSDGGGGGGGAGGGVVGIFYKGTLTETGTTQATGGAGGTGGTGVGTGREGVNGATGSAGTVHKQRL